jgi:hypothetical protein
MEQPQSAGVSRGRWMAIVIVGLVLGAIAFALLVGFGSGVLDDDGGSSSTPAPLGFEETWNKSLVDANCGDFLNRMQDGERRMTASAYLSALWQRDGYGPVEPSDAALDEFASDIATICEGDDDVDVSEVALMLYSADADYWRPFVQ